MKNLSLLTMDANFNKELCKKNLSENLKSTDNPFDVFYGTATSTLSYFDSLNKKIALIITNLSRKKLLRKL